MRGQRERRQRLVEREVVLQVDGQPDRAGRSSSGSSSRSTTPPASSAAVDRDGPADVLALGAPVLVVVGRAGAASRRTASPGRAITLSSIAWLTAKLRGQRLGLGGDQPLEGRLAPADRALRRLLALRPCAASSGRRRPWRAPCSFSMTCSGACTTTVPTVSKPARPARPAIWWNSRALSSRGLDAVVLGQAGEQHRADRHVDADAEGVGAADDLEQAGLGERLDQPAVLRQHPGVVHADAVPHQPGQRLAEAGGEPEAADRLGDRVLLAPGCTTLMLISAWARSSAAAWVKCTT